MVPPGRPTDGYSAAGRQARRRRLILGRRPTPLRNSSAHSLASHPSRTLKVVIIVVIDEPAGSYHGGEVAAQFFREMRDRFWPDLGVMPDIETRQLPN